MVQRESRCSIKSTLVLLSKAIFPFPAIFYFSPENRSLPNACVISFWMHWSILFPSWAGLNRSPLLAPRPSSLAPSSWSLVYEGQAGAGTATSPFQTNGPLDPTSRRVAQEIYSWNLTGYVYNVQHNHNAFVSYTSIYENQDHTCFIHSQHILPIAKFHALIHVFPNSP